MVQGSRRTWSTAIQQLGATANCPIAIDDASVTSSRTPGPDDGNSTVATEQIDRLPTVLTTKNTRLSKSDLATLLRKRQWLQTYSPTFPALPTRTNPYPRLHDVVDATLVFAQEEAGTAVCISPDGLLLTCSHCISEDADWHKSKTAWLIFASGHIVKAECIAWDGRRDLALCQIVATGDNSVKPTPRLEANHSSTTITTTHASECPNNGRPVFPFVSVSENDVRKATALICVGHPGAEDLESVVPGTKTNYDVLYVSAGKHRGYASGQDMHDNEDIGALMHDCWTYWGHSGAPLVSVPTSLLVGLHSSWDSATGMRRGVGLEAIREFLRLNGGLPVTPFVAN